MRKKARVQSQGYGCIYLIKRGVKFVRNKLSFLFPNKEGIHYDGRPSYLRVNMQFSYLYKINLAGAEECIPGMKNYFK